MAAESTERSDAVISCSCVLLLAIGCGEAAPPSFTTDHLTVFPSDSDRVCRGTLDNLEAQVVRAAGILRLETPRTLHVDLGASAIETYCGDDAGGCATGFYKDTRVVADDSSAYHELVHGVRRANGLRVTRFFEEGIAQALSGFRPFPILFYGDPNAATFSPAMLATAAWNEITYDHYGVAGHFTSWMLMTFGEEAVAGFLNDEQAASAETLGAAFAEHFGLTLDEAEAAWRETAEDTYWWGQRCDPAVELAWQGSVLEYQTRLDCDEPRTLGPGYGSTLSQFGACLRLDQPGDLRVELIADAGQAQLVYDGTCGGGGLTAEHFQQKTIAAGEAADFPFAACHWEIQLSTDSTAPTDVTIRITRH